MLDHHLQRAIVYRLAFAPELRFSELKPDDIESKLFTYHLKKVVSAGYAAKQTDGNYALTPEGRRMGLRLLEKEQATADKAESVLFLIIRRKSDGAWLLYKRATHPLLGRVGFMHAIPNAEETTAQTSARVCHEKTGLETGFVVLGSGYFRVFEEDALESFTHFTLLVCEDAKGQLAEHDEFAEYYWDASPNFADETMLPNMPVLVDLYQAGKPFFIEKTIHLP